MTTTYQVTNNTSSPRLIFHAGPGNAHGGTLVERGATVTVKMTKAEAENAETPGLEIVKGDKPASGERVFLATADDAEGSNFDLLSVPAGKFIGFAVAETEPQGPSAFRWQPVNAPVSGVQGVDPAAPQPAPEPGPDQASAPDTSLDSDGDKGPEPAKAVHRGAGSYSVMRGDVELVEHLKKADAEAFNDLDDAGKEAFIADRAKPAE